MAVHMRFFLILAFAAAFSILPARAGLSPEAREYLAEVGLDPNSAEIAPFAGDVVRTRNGPVSIDDLARQKRSRREILRFVSTRRFVQEYRRDPGTRLPATDDYSAAYVSDDEKKMVQPAFRKAGDELYLRSLQQGKKP